MSFMVTSSQRACSLALCILVAPIGSACGASSVSRPAIERPGPHSQGYYTTYAPRDLALGRPAAGERRAVSSAPDLTPFLEPVDVARAPQRVNRAQPAAKAELAKAPAPLPPVQLASMTTTTSPDRATAPATGEDLQRYAAREQKSQQQGQFRGGDVIVISVSTLLIILLIVILVLLLT